jgi:hypothetical protein
MSLTIRLSCLAPPHLIVDDIRSEPNRLFQRFGFWVRRSALITAARRKLSRSRCCGEAKTRLFLLNRDSLVQKSLQLGRSPRHPSDRPMLVWSLIFYGLEWN